ncbi:MAG: hypothetical protein OEY11_08805 [Gammaproteobacteria bacterium]|nr:hypothetical protein [Gammaproteobacteria bacterium]
MFYYYLMAIFILMALGAVKIDGWSSALLLSLAALASSPVFELPSKKLKWAIVIVLTSAAIMLFPDIEQYRQAFEQSLETAPIPTKD